MYQQTALKTGLARKVQRSNKMEATTEEKRFCSNESCLTDEVNVRRVSRLRMFGFLRILPTRPLG